MFSKTLIAASALGVASASTAQSHKKFAMPEGQKVDIATIDLSAVGKVTTGVYAYEDVTACPKPAGNPISVSAYKLNTCQGNILFADSSNIYDWCGWNADKSIFYYNQLSYGTEDCTGAITSNYTYSVTGLTDGCGGALQYNYLCGDYKYSDYGSPQHIGDFLSPTCGGEENGWGVFSWSSCTDDSDCLTFTDNYSTKGICDDPDDVCFHIDTKIDYKGIEYTYEELKAGKESECTVPHTPSSKGVVITTSCDKTVRVTDTHLMATTKGFQLAYSLKAGDVMYGDYGKETCIVKSVEKEKTTQQYFGLNCVHSEVLASGLRASTFGDFHTLPSWYMTYVGGLVGSEAASSLGEYVAEWYYH